jgi:hypothetical protein
MKRGIVLFTIQPDGTLIGEYTNETINRVLIETATLIGARNENPILGRYRSLYSEEDIQIIAELEITPGTHNTLIFNWRTENDNGKMYTGWGYQMNPQQIAAYYELLP